MIIPQLLGQEGNETNEGVQGVIQPPKLAVARTLTESVDSSYAKLHGTIIRAARCRGRFSPEFMELKRKIDSLAERVEKELGEDRIETALREQAAKDWGNRFTGEDLEKRKADYVRFGWDAYLTDQMTRHPEILALVNDIAFTILASDYNWRMQHGTKEAIAPQILKGTREEIALLEKNLAEANAQYERTKDKKLEAYIERIKDRLEECKATLGGSLTELVYSNVENGRSVEDVLRALAEGNVQDLGILPEDGASYLETAISLESRYGSKDERVQRLETLRQKAPNLIQDIERIERDERSPSGIMRYINKASPQCESQFMYEFVSIPIIAEKIDAAWQNYQKSLEGKVVQIEPLEEIDEKVKIAENDNDLVLKRIVAGITGIAAGLTIVYAGNGKLQKISEGVYRLIKEIF